MNITRGSAADIPALEPLWVEVHRAHVASMPELAPYVTDEETWAERRAFYEKVMAQPDSVLLLAHADGSLIGYALAHVAAVRDTWIFDTWVTGERIAEIESLSVLPEHRGNGLGSALMDELEREIPALGIDDVIVGALAGNETALRLYARRGFRPTWLYMSRFGGR